MWNWIAFQLSESSFLLRVLLWWAKHFPYEPLPGYMDRWWLVKPGGFWNMLLPPMRFHHILREDNDRHPHDHPWAFRSLILKGGYLEELLTPLFSRTRHPIESYFCGHIAGPVEPLWGDTFSRRAGTSHSFNLGDYHRITAVTKGGVLTLVILGEKQTHWGFLVDGEKVHWKYYFAHQNQEIPW